MLRSFQEHAINELKRLIIRSKQLKRRFVPVIYLPTGGGKTVIAIELISRMLAKKPNTTAFFMVNRVVLVDQVISALLRVKIIPNIIQGNNTVVRDHSRVSIISGKSLHKYLDSSDDGLFAVKKELPDIVIIDEAHEFNLKVALFCQACVAAGKLVIGLSATPLNSKMNELYDYVINVVTTNKLIEMGFLVPLTVYSPLIYQKTKEYNKLLGSSGEFNESLTTDLARCIVGDTVRQYIIHGGDKKFICCGTTIEHCADLKRDFQLAGIKTELYTCDIDDDYRRDVMSEFRSENSKIRGLIAVNSLTTGVDVPDLGCIIITRAYQKSVIAMIQLLGRVMRSCQGKTEAIVIDMVGNYPHFYNEISEIFNNGVNEIPRKLTHKTRKETEKDTRFSKLKRCKSCDLLYKPNSHKICPSCGTPYKKLVKVITQIDGEYVKMET